MTSAIVLAAGASTRMGTAKQLALLDGRPLLAHAVEAARSCQAVERVVVVLGAREKAVRAGVKLTGVEVVRCAEWSRGTAVTLRAGLGLMADGDEAVVLLGDQPGVHPEAITRVLARSRERGACARAAHGGEPRHPLVLAPPVVAALRASTVAQASGHARDLLAAHRIDLVACDDLGGADDVDTPEDLARAAAALPKS